MNLTTCSVLTLAEKPSEQFQLFPARLVGRLVLQELVHGAAHLGAGSGLAVVHLAPIKELGSPCPLGGWSLRHEVNFEDREGSKRDGASRFA